MWLFLLAARHRMQALSALACSVGCAFSGFASLKIALFIQPLSKEDDPFYFWVILFADLFVHLFVFIFCDKSFFYFVGSVCFLVENPMFD